MSREEEARLRRELSRSECYLEYGAGGSTVAAVQARVPEIHVKETSPEYLARVLKDLTPEEAARVTPHSVDMGAIGGWGYPKVTPSPSVVREFCSVPSSVTPDLVLVDGRFRVACALTAAASLPKGTRILLHDAHRAWFNEVRKWLTLRWKVETLHCYEKSRDDIGVPESFFADAR